MRKKIKKIAFILIISIIYILIANKAYAKPTITSYDYEIDKENQIISRISPKTNIADFKVKLNLEMGNDSEEIYEEELKKITIYKDNTLKDVVEEGYIGTGMILKYDENTYQISVVGDFDGDGEATQVELTKIIRYIVGLKGSNLEGINYISADLTGDNQVDQRDITKFIRYIVFGELDLGKTDNIDNTKPVIEEVTATTSSITIKAKDESSGIIGYVIKETNEEPKSSEFIACANTKNFIKTVTDKEQEKTYYVWVKDAAGNISDVVPIKTSIVPALTDANTIFTANPSEWTNQNVEVNVQTTVTGYTLQTSLDGENWENVISRTFTENGSIYARLTDGKNTGNYIIGKVENIDKVRPIITEATGTTNKIKIKATDEASGIIRYAVTETNIEPTEFTSCNNTKSLDIEVTGKEQGKTYYVWVKDAAGNINSNNNDSNKVTTGNIPDLTTANTTFTANPSEWTNQNVILTASTTVTGYTLQTSLDGENWENVTSRTFTENGSMYARLTDGENAGGSCTGTVANIDKIRPIITEATGTTNKIKIKATDEASGIIGYAVTETNIEPTEFTSCNNTKSLDIEITGKEQGKTYYVWVKDAAGNINSSDNDSNKVTTGNIPNLTTANTTFTANPSEWTNQNVILTASTTVTGYTLQTSLDGENWENVTSRTFTENGSMYARLTDGENAGGSCTGTVANIDKIRPIITETTGTTNKIKIKATDEASGIVGYAVTETNIEPTEFTSCNNTKSLDIEVTGKKQGKTYYVWVKDAAGNINSNNNDSNKVTTGNVPNLTTANTTFTANPSEWTNQNVILTASTTVAGYTLQTSLDGQNWENVTSRTFTQNGSMYARLTDGENAGGYSTGTVGNIDKIIPEDATISINTANKTVSVTHNDLHSGVRDSSCKWMFNTTSSEIGTNPSNYTGGTFGTNPQTINVNLDEAGRYYLHVLTVDLAGNSKETVSDVIVNELPLVNKVSVGDYVAYDATDNYSYTSESGGVLGDAERLKEGNGYSNKLFKSKSDMKWRVLNKNQQTGEVIIISNEPVTSETSGMPEGKNLRIMDITGFIYVKSTLNKICAIYGHGVGADTSKRFGWWNGLSDGYTEEIEGTGARTITMEDINKIISNSGTRVKNGPISGWYPTWKKDSSVKGSRKYTTNFQSECTIYDYIGKNYLSNNNISYDIIFGKNDDYRYFIGETYVGEKQTDLNGIEYLPMGVQVIEEGKVTKQDLAGFEISTDSQENSLGYFKGNWKDGKCVRPVVYLKTTLKTDGKDSNGAWRIIDN